MNRFILHHKSIILDKTNHYFAPISVSIYLDAPNKHRIPTYHDDLILNFILYLGNFQLLHFYTNRAYNNFNNTFVVKCFIFGYTMFFIIT